MSAKSTYLIISWFSAMIICFLTFPPKFSVLFVYLFAAMSLFALIKEKKRIQVRNEFIVLTFLFAAVHAVHIFMDSNQSAASFELEKKLSWFILPFLWYNLPFSNNRKFVDETLKIIGRGIAIFGWGLILFTTYRFVQTGNRDVFFYHELVSFWNGNAVYYSLLFSISILLLLGELKQPNWLLFSMIVTNSVLILALSSKVFAVAMIVFLTYLLLKNRKYLLLAFIYVCLIASQFILQEKSVSSRFKELNVSEFAELNAEITPATEFDGFTLRKELWNIGIELLEENPSKIWLGIGPGDVQERINQKIREKNFYLGDGTDEDQGFLNYNMHNQYLQTLLEVGIFGLFLLIGLFWYLISLGFRTKNSQLIWVNVLFLFVFLTESFLSRQVGIISFLALNSLFVFKEKYHSMNSLSYTIKRLFDIVFSLFVIVFILSWLLPILAIIILFDTKAMPVFVQERVGKNGVHFNCFKLRSMIKNQDAHRLAAQENDARITKIGGFLRKYAIDELPQFFNVLFGQMSIVGPRPLMIFEEKKFNELVPNFSARLTRRPGITGLAQSYGYKGMVYDLADIRIRMRLDMMYDLKQSLWLDIKLIGNTIYYLVKQVGR